MSNLCMTSRKWAAKNESCFKEAILTASKMICTSCPKALHIEKCDNLVQFHGLLTLNLHDVSAVKCIIHQLVSDLLISRPTDKSYIFSPW